MAEGIENMESELHLAAIDTEIIDKENSEIFVDTTDENTNSQDYDKLLPDTEEKVSSADEVDTVVPVASAPEADELIRPWENVTTMNLVEIAPSAPVLEENPCTIPGKNNLSLL